MAKVVGIHGFGGPEVLSLDEVNVRDPGPGEVQIKVGAIGLNRAETMILSGELQHFALKDEAVAGRVTFLHALAHKGVKTSS
jgi:NADPH:quinone reductase-like Zn-dependent oxidoreductase